MLDKGELHVLYLGAQPHLLIIASPFLIPHLTLRAVPNAHLHCPHFHLEPESDLILVLVNDVGQDVIFLKDIYFPLKVLLGSYYYLCEVLYFILCQEFEIHDLTASLL
jgi:hypothetical protein